MIFDGAEASSAHWVLMCLDLFIIYPFVLIELSIYKCLQGSAGRAEPFKLKSAAPVSPSGAEAVSDPSSAIA